jgi:hypothetical protein
MEGTEFFERMGPRFAEQAGGARANAERQADVERLITRAEYECLQMRRELVGLIPLAAEAPSDDEHVEVALPADAKAA